MLPVPWRNIFAIVGDGGPGEVEGAAIGGGDDFDGVWVGHVLGSAEHFERGDLDVRLSEGAEKGGEMFRFEERFVALNIDVDVGWEISGNSVDPIGTAG